MKNIKFVILTLLFLGTLNACKGQSKQQEVEEVESYSKIIKGNKITIFFPAASEIDSLKKLWGEEKFYIVADDENARLAELYKMLNKNKMAYQTTQKDKLDTTAKR